MDAELPLAGFRCGQCGYCVRGLPLRGRCPECGTGYFADPYGSQSANFNALLVPSIAIALSWALSVGSAGSSIPMSRWVFFVCLALAIVWAKRTARSVAQAAYFDRLAATPIDRPPPDRRWYLHTRSVLFFLTQIAMAIAVIFLASVLLTRSCR